MPFGSVRGTGCPAGLRSARSQRTGTRFIDLWVMISWRIRETPEGA
jgi:hypothetical protein